MRKKILARVHRLVRRKSADASAVTESSPENDVRITNETIAARREEVLGSARKYIYPLQASRHRIVGWSIGIFIVAIVGFFTFCLLELYKFQSTSAFIYGVTRVIPFPVALADHHLISYNDYLFELRHYMHYYETQVRIDFSSVTGKQQLIVSKENSLDRAIESAYVQELADKNHVSVSDQDVDAAVAQVRNENRLGASDAVFRSVLSEFWGWSVDDFRRELRQELLAQKLVDTLDTATHARANQALSRLQAGADFAALAKEVSDDVSTGANGGEYGYLIGKSDTTLPPQVLDQLFKLQQGKYSGIINTGYSLEIVKVIEVQGSQVRAAHITFNFQPVSNYTKPLRLTQKPHPFIHV